MDLSGIVGIISLSPLTTCLAALLAACFQFLEHPELESQGLRLQSDFRLLGLWSRAQV